MGLLIETAEIISIIPYIPNIAGLFIAGGHPQTPCGKYPAPGFSAVSDG
jgi:hypothetical protein